MNHPSLPTRTHTQVPRREQADPDGCVEYTSKHTAPVVLQPAEEASNHSLLMTALPRYNAFNNNFDRNQSDIDAEAAFNKATIEQRKVKDLIDAASAASVQATNDIEAVERAREALQAKTNEAAIAHQRREQEINARLEDAENAERKAIIEREDAAQGMERAREILDDANAASVKAAIDIEAVKRAHEQLESKKNEADVALQQREQEINARLEVAENAERKAIIEREGADTVAREKLLHMVNEVKGILPILDNTNLPPQKRTKRKGATTEDMNNVMGKLREHNEDV